MQLYRNIAIALSVSIMCLGLIGCAASRPVAEPPAAPPIVLDGDLDDWAGIQPTIVDPIDAPDCFVDFGAVSIAHDEQFVHLLIDFGRVVNPQGLDGTGHVLLDVDGSESTGKAVHGMPGVDLIVVLTPPNSKRPDRPGRGIGLRLPAGDAGNVTRETDELSPYDIEFSFAPTHASRRVEFRMRRGISVTGAPPAFTGSRFSGKLVYVENSTILDTTDVFTHALTNGPIRALLPAQPGDPLSRSNDELRVVSWNGEWGALFARPEPFMRVLRSLDPDVILLQELKSKSSVAALEQLFNTRLPLEDGQRWNAVFGEGGGNLRCGIVSRLPLTAAGPISLVSYPQEPHRQVRVAGTIVEWNGMRVLAASVHLKCCGRKDSSEDKKRMVEVRLIGDALAETCAQQPVDAMIIGGDFNLVGGRAPLDALLIGRDLDGSSLATADPMQLDELSNATWQDPNQPFAPGRLDFVVYSDEALKRSQAFIYDSCDMAHGWLDVHGVSATDVLEASDHLPVVVDFRRRLRQTP